MVYFHDESLAERIAALYRELPALRLTTSQAARLFSVPTSHVEPVLTRLESGGRLRRSDDGSFWAAA